jgi:uncharacterized protein (TIGR03435 family)
MISISLPGSPTFTATNVNLEILIGMAYGVDSDNITAAPSWLGSQQYDVSAKALHSYFRNDSNLRFIAKRKKVRVMH